MFSLSMMPHNLRGPDTSALQYFGILYTTRHTDHQRFTRWQN